MSGSICANSGPQSHLAPLYHWLSTPTTAQGHPTSSHSYSPYTVTLEEPTTCDLLQRPEQRSSMSPVTLVRRKAAQPRPLLWGFLERAVSREINPGLGQSKLQFTTRGFPKGTTGSFGSTRNWYVCPWAPARTESLLGAPRPPSPPSCRLHPPTPPLAKIRRSLPSTVLQFSGKDRIRMDGKDRIRKRWIRNQGELRRRPGGSESGKASWREPLRSVLKGQGGFSQVKGKSDPGRLKSIGRDQESGWSRE